MSGGLLQTEYVGRRGPLFWIAFRSGILTVLTLGLYRFWMRTRLRRYYWSAIRPGGQPLEYVGDPLEKLLGFLVAVVFVAFYLGVVNLVLMFMSFAVLNDNKAAYAVSLIGIVPVIFYARYRARRYILARTRWRGVRFGVTGGAWGYAARAIFHWTLTVLSLGLLWPRMTFFLEKYRADHTVFGTEAVIQRGRWTMLYRPFLPLVLGVAMVVAGAIAIGTVAGVVALVAGLVVFGLGLAHYRARSFRLLTDHKAVGPLTFRARPGSLRVAWIYLSGYALVFLCTGAVAAILGIPIVALIVQAAGTGGLDPAAFEQAPPILLTIAGILVYFSVFILFGSFRHVFVTLPLARHFAETLEILGADKLPDVRQRARDEFSEAEGIADALDLGAAL